VDKSGLVASALGAAVAQEYQHVPGLVLGLRHTSCKSGVRVMYGCQPPLSHCPEGNTDSRFPDQTRMDIPELMYKCIPDYGAEKGIGFAFNILRETGQEFDTLRHLPPGLLLALSHTKGQYSSVLGLSPTPSLDNTAMQAELAKRGLRYMHAFDTPESVLFNPTWLGEAGEVTWFETTGEDFLQMPIENQRKVLGHLPRHTVIGLRHNRDNKDDPNRAFWIAGILFDPLSRVSLDHLGFRLIDGGDRGAPAGTGFLWYEKLDGYDFYARGINPVSPGVPLQPSPGLGTSQQPLKPEKPMVPVPLPQQPSWTQPGEDPGPPAIFVGCYPDNPQADPAGTSGRDLDGAVLNSPVMTRNRCLRFCKERHFRFAGLQFGSWCFCGNAMGRYPRLSASCTMRCSGNSNQFCGGEWANNIWEIP
jgi:hypothetical protein